MRVRVPELVPPAVGANVTVTVQEPPTAMLVQLLAWLKAPVAETPETVAVPVPDRLTAKSPLMDMDETEAAALVGLVTVTLCAALVVPVTCELKVSALGLVVTPLLRCGG